MAEPLRLLFLYRSESEIQPLLAQLKKEGVSAACEWGLGVDFVLSALTRAPWDAVLADSGAGMDEVVSSFRVARRTAPNLAFLLIARPEDEPVLGLAAEAGIEEFVFGDRLSRLLPSLRKSMRAGIVRKEREHALARLRESENRFRRLIEDSKQCIVIHRGFKPLFVNRALVESLGYADAEEVLALESVMRWIAPDEHARLAGFADARLRGGTAPEVYVFRGIRKDGSTLWLQNVSQVVEWEGGPAIQSIYVDVTAHHEAEEARRRGDALLKLLADSSQDLIFRYRLWPERAFEFVSESAARLTGYSAEEHYADPELAFKMVHPDDLQAFREMLDNPERLERPVVLRWARKDGEVIWCEFRGAVIRDPGGRPIAIQGVARDVSRSMRTEARLRAILEGSIQGILVHRDRKPLFANSAFAQMHGFGSIQEVYALETLEVLVHPGDSERMTEYGRARLAGESAPARYEYRAFRKDGSEFWVEHLGSVIPWDDGPAILATIVDITARKQAEAQLRASESRYRLLTENAHDVIFRYRIRPEPGFDFISPACIRVCGYTPEEYLADPELPFQVVHPDDRQAVRSYFADPPIAPALLTVRLRRKDGRVIWVEQHNAVVVDADGIPIAVEGTVRDISERMQREELFRLVVESAPYGMLIVNGAGAIIQVNAQLEKDFLYDRAELIGKPVEVLIPEQHRASHVRRREAFAAAPKVRPMGSGLGLLGRRKDGSTFPLEISLAPFDATQGKMVLAVALDVSEQRRAEAALRDQRELLQTVFDSLPAWIVLKDIEGRYLLVNRQRELDTGLSRESYAGKTPLELPYGKPEELRRVAEDDRRVLSTGERVETPDYPMTGLDGKLRFHHSIKVPFRDAEGHVKGLVGFSEDITERKRSEEALRASRNLLQTIFDTVPLWITVKDAGGRYLMANRMFSNQSGISLEGFVGRTSGEILNGSSEERGQIEELDRRVLEGRDALLVAEVELTGKDGTRRVFSTTRAPMRDDLNRITGLITVSEDVTQRKKLEEQFTAAQRMEAIGQLAGGVAHDFNNLLAVILSYSGFVLDAIREDEPVKADVQEIMDAATRGAALTRQLLAFSRRQTLELRNLDLNELIDGTIKMLGRLMGEDIRIKTTLESDLGLIRADSIQIEQVIMNLAVNARDAMPRGGEFLIETSNVALDEAFAHEHLDVKPGEHVLLSVSDTGLGMDEATRKRIFEPFFTTKEKGKGTGLGLSTVFGIVTQLEGHIWVYSEPGVGTTFKIYFPRSAADSRATATVAGTRPSLRGSETILLVEDEEKVREAARRILEKQGYRVMVAEDSRQAIHLASDGTQQVDLLVSDVVMPGISGPELAEEVRIRRPALRVLLMSGYTPDALQRHFAEPQSVQLVQKPFTATELLRKVREVLDRP